MFCKTLNCHSQLHDYKLQHTKKSLLPSSCLIFYFLSTFGQAGALLFVSFLFSPETGLKPFLNYTILDAVVKDSKISSSPHHNSVAWNQSTNWVRVILICFLFHVLRVLRQSLWYIGYRKDFAFSFLFAVDDLLTFSYLVCLIDQLMLRNLEPVVPLRYRPAEILIRCACPHLDLQPLCIRQESQIL